MNINILGYDNKIEFEQGRVNVLEISNKRTFTNFILNFNELCKNEKFETNIITLHGNDNELLKFSKEVDIVIDIFNIELNSKKILTKLYDKMESSIENKDKIIEVMFKLRELLYNNIEEFPFDFNIREEIDILSILKLYDIKIDEDMYIDFSQKLFFLVDIISELKIAKILIIPNLKSYLNDVELIEFYKYTMYKELKLLIIENKFSNDTLTYEKKMQIDDNYDDIVI